MNISQIVRVTVEQRLKKVRQELAEQSNSLVQIEEYSNDTKQRIQNLKADEKELTDFLEQAGESDEIYSQ